MTTEVDQTTSEDSKRGSKEQNLQTENNKTTVLNPYRSITIFFNGLNYPIKRTS